VPTLLDGDGQAIEYGNRCVAGPPEDTCSIKTQIWSASRRENTVQEPIVRCPHLRVDDLPGRRGSGGTVVNGIPSGKLTAAKPILRKLARGWAAWPHAA